MKYIENMRVSYDQAVELQKNAGAIIVDVRTSQEHYEKTLPETDLHINLYDNFEVTIQKLDPKKIYITYCRSGGRSQTASAIMREHGLMSTDIIGGILQ